MRKQSSRREFLIATITLTSAASIGCGTVLHPERVGQKGGKIDWRVAAMDGAGLLLFLVPGIVAFAVDFYNGTIYLPDSYAANDNVHRGDDQLVEFSIPKPQLNQNKIESVVSGHVGRDIQLTKGSYRSERLAHIGQFWDSVERIGGRQNRG